MADRANEVLNRERGALWSVAKRMFDNPQSVAAGEHLAPVVEQRECRPDVAAFVCQGVAHFERTLPHLRSLYKPCSRQVSQRGAEHLLGYPRDLAAELGKTARPVSDRRENDCAPASTERRQRHVHATHVQSVLHVQVSSKALTSW